MLSYMLSDIPTFSFVYFLFLCYLQCISTVKKHEFRVDQTFFCWVKVDLLSSEILVHLYLFYKGQYTPDYNGKISV